MTDELDLEALYRAERRAAGLAYREANPAGYFAILKAVMQEYAGQSGQFREKMQTVQLRCAKASGFPDLATWKATKMETAQ